MKVLRSFLRVYLAPDRLESAVVFYEGLFGVRCDMRFKYSGAGLELASIGPVLLVAGPEERLSAFRHTQATFLVDSLDEFRSWLIMSGSEILDEPKNVPTGRNMRVRHPDGTIVEYVEHASKRIQT